MLEVPLSKPALPLGFEAAFGARLAIDPEWFECPTCAVSYRARLTPVLADLSLASAVPAARRDGHRRALVLQFEGLTNGKWVPVTALENASCKLVSAVRAAGASALGVVISDGFATQPDLLVSRSCEVLVQDAEGWLPPSTTEWAKQRIGADPMPSLPAVDLALVDTGVPAAYRAGLGVVSEKGLPGFEPGGSAYHPHGAHMAALIHDIAPHATIRSYRALGAGGLGSLASLARATDDALFDNGWTVSARRPLVVNLSVGAPPDFFSPAVLDGPGCSTWEDGAGEALRYVFNVAGLLDQQVDAQQRWNAVFIAAASGNSGLERAFTSQTPWTRGPPMTSCGFAASGSASSFLPAGFGEWPSCRGPSWAWLPVLPVGASTFADQRSSLTRRASEPRLYAPGERVYAANPTLPAAPLNLSCAAGDVGLSHGFESPASVSGTSASTALVSAAAANLIARGTFSGGARAADLARLLFLTGDPLCQGGVALAGRRLSLKRANVASNAPNCAALRSCVRSPSLASGPLLSGATAPVCAAALEACLGVAPVCAATPAEEPGWGSGYESTFTSASSCTQAWFTASTAGTRRLTGPNARFPDVQLAGLGPQPAGSGCPNCAVLIARNSVWVEFELTDALPAGAKLLDVQLVLLNQDKDPVAWSTVGDGREWQPGEAGLMLVTDFGPELGSDEVARHLRAGDWSALIDLGLDLDGKVARLVSPLRTELRR